MLFVKIFFQKTVGCFIVLTFLFKNLLFSGNETGMDLVACTKKPSLRKLERVILKKILLGDIQFLLIVWRKQ